MAHGDSKHGTEKVLLSHTGPGAFGIESKGEADPEQALLSGKIRSEIEAENGSKFWKSTFGKVLRVGGLILVGASLVICLLLVLGGFVIIIVDIWRDGVREWRAEMQSITSRQQAPAPLQCEPGPKAESVQSPSCPVCEAATCPPTPMAGCKHADATIAPVQKVLKKPAVILVSLDGFRWGYQYKVPTPNIDRLRVNGTEAINGLIPVYPSVTFPNHYSIATGLYPASHGIIANSFPDPNNASRKFTMTSHDPDWWLGEPIWETAVKQGLGAATFFWPGSEVHKEEWKCPAKFCKHYNGNVPYEERVDTVLAWMDLPEATQPSIVTLYFDEPDHSGHSFGPDAPQIGVAVARVDAMIGRLLDGLESRNILDDVHVIVLGDHGMLANCLAREVYVDDFKPWLPKISTKWFDSYTPLMAIRPPAGMDAKEIVEGFRKGLESKQVNHGEFLQIYLKEDLPGRFNYSNNDRIQPILGILAEGYSARFRKPTTCTGDCIGSHGYDNALLSMRTIFFARGPRFARGRQVEAFRNVEVYGLISDILGLKAAPNNGTATFPDFMLLPAS